MNTSTMLLGFGVLVLGAYVTMQAMHAPRNEWQKLANMAAGLLLSVFAIGFIFAAALLRRVP